MQKKKVTPVFPWLGGKTRLVNQLLPLFKDHHCFVEPFAGAAAVLFAKEPTPVEVLNDINGDIVNLYRVVQNHLEEFVRQFKYALVSRQMFEWEKMKNPETLTDIQRAARFFYLQKTCFGARSEGRTFGTSPTRPSGLNLLRIEEDLSAAHLRLARVFIENLDWQACIAKYDRPETLFFCDPPYYGLTGYGVEFDLNQYAELGQMMHTIQGAAVLTINDCPEMRRVFTGFPFIIAKINYSCGNARTQKRQESQELIITNYKIPNSPEL